MTNVSRNHKRPIRRDAAAARRVAQVQDRLPFEPTTPRTIQSWKMQMGALDRAKIADELPSDSASSSSASAAEVSHKPAIMPFTRLFIATVDAILHLPAPTEDGIVRGANTFAREGDLRRFLEPTLQKLVKRGVLRSVRGPRGGYALGKRRSDITLAELMDATISEKRSERAKIVPRSNLGHIVDSVLSNLEAKWSRDLCAITLEDLDNRRNGEIRG